MSLRKEFLTEVEGGLEVEVEIGILGSGLDLLLRMVERKRPHIIHIRSVGTDNDALGLFVGAQHAIAISEEAFGVEVLREQEGFFGLFKSLHTVERKDGGCLSLGALGICLIAVAVGIGVSMIVGGAKLIKSKSSILL